MKNSPRVFFGLLPFAAAELLWLTSQAFSFTQAVAIALVSWSVLILPELLFNPSGEKKIRRWRLALVLLAGLFFFIAVDGLAGALVFLSFSCFAFLCMIAVEGLSRNFSPWISWLTAAGMALFFGCSVMGILQVIERFSEEEFFVAVQVVLLSAWWFLLYLTWRVVSRPRDRFQALACPSHRTGVAVLLPVVMLGVGFVVFNRYQASFFPPTVETYPGITEDTPFLCEQTPSEMGAAAYGAREVYQGLIERAAASLIKPAYLLGMLAVSDADQRWKEEFHQELLKEARQGKYTGPAGSVKFGQYEMALRVYFFHEVDLKYPDLFSKAEKQLIMDWFAAANQRSLTVEWVDWMYSAAFGEMPAGPYLNQEIGTSFLALLETYGYAEPALSGQNQAFLSAHRLGWNQRFRNTDDSISYQALWINNAFFQSLLTGVAPDDRVMKSFEWLLLQARPDGSPVGYNPYQISLAESAYLGAQMTGDGRFLWLAGRALEYLQNHDLFAYAQPGLNGAVNLESNPPDTGSCLIFAGSGTPVRTGPLAPDKIVFRDGWQPGDRYLSLNLRFTGWHRYKATNSIISVYQDEPLIIERTDSAPTSWLPVGRSMFRDKRIPRENLNGLVISRRGLSQLVFWITGYGSPWAQDPPFYAQVEAFQTGADMDQSVTRMQWNGWTQVRKVYFVHDGPTVIIDEAYGPKNQPAGILWHGAAPEDCDMVEGEAAGNRFPLGKKGNAEMVVLPFGEGRVTCSADEEVNPSGITVRFTNESGMVKLATLFLSDSWREATINITDGILLIQNPGKLVKIPLSPGS